MTDVNSLYGLAFDCPYFDRQDDCPLKEMEQLHLRERVNWINSLSQERWSSARSRTTDACRCWQVRRTCPLRRRSKSASWPETLRAAVAILYQKGADGIYLFNFYDREEYPLLTDFSDPARLARQSKEYFLYPDYRRLPGYHLTGMLSNGAREQGPLPVECFDLIPGVPYKIAWPKDKILPIVIRTGNELVLKF